MTVYDLRSASDEFHDFALAEEEESTIYPRFNGTPFGSSWTPLEITAADEDDELALLADHALLGTVPVFSEKAVRELRNVLEANGELLPLIYSRGQYFAYNVTAVVDALDEGGSTITRFPSGRVMTVEKYAFRANALREKQVFKIPQLLRAFVFVTDGFVERVRGTTLSGFVFEEIWRDSGTLARA